DPLVQPQYFDESGRLHVSWRVHLLGLLGEQALLDRFHLDEPYHSPHNQALIAEMPDIYRDVDAPDDTCVTRYLAVDGSGSIFEGGRFRNLDDITDAPGETMLIAVVPKERAVIWTQPEDLIVDPANP